VRLKHAYFIVCKDVVKDEKTGEVLELRCTYDPETKSGSSPSGRKVKGTLHWVSADHAVDAEVRLYEHLFDSPDPLAEGGEEFQDLINENSLVTLTGCKVESGLRSAEVGEYYQFLRQGYFSVDPVESSRERLVFNRSVGLRDSWAKIEKSQGKRRK
jgi:glutaminyl-tRNA synthetase